MRILLLFLFFFAASCAVFTKHFTEANEQHSESRQRVVSKKAYTEVGLSVESPASDGQLEKLQEDQTFSRFDFRLRVAVAKRLVADNEHFLSRVSAELPFIYNHSETRRRAYGSRVAAGIEYRSGMFTAWGRSGIGLRALRGGGKDFSSETYFEAQGGLGASLCLGEICSEIGYWHALPSTEGDFAKPSSSWFEVSLVWQFGVGKDGTPSKSSLSVPPEPQAGVI